tara:strand:+ start:178 stop:780 length:603 start_codon:yes stop_codon:yes gene_type:complete
MRLISAILILSLPNVLLASEHGDVQTNDLRGFIYKGAIINPKCVNLLQTWSSESSAYGIINRSIIIDSCQDSNLAYEGRDFSVGKDGTVSYYEDPRDAHSYFGYKVVGRTLNNIFVLFHSGYIGLYRLEEQEITFDFSQKTKKSVLVLTKISGSWTPCFDAAETRGNALIVRKGVWDSSAPRSSQCTEATEELTFDLRNF